MLALINGSEYILIPLINKHSFQLREEYIHILNIPVHEMLIKTFLREYPRPGLMQFLPVCLKLLRPGRQAILEPLHQIVPHIHPCLMEEPAPGGSIHLGPHEVDLCAQLLGLLAGKLDLQAWHGEIEIMAEPVMELEKPVISPEPRLEDVLSRIHVILDPAIAVVTLEILSVCVELLLGINKLQHLCLRPPSLTCLHIHCIWLDLLNELLRSLCQHCALVHRADQVDLLAVEAFSEVDHGGLEAGLPVADALVGRGLQVGCPDEDMPGEGGGDVRSHDSLVDGLVPVYSVRHTYKGTIIINLITIIPFTDIVLIISNL